MPVYEDHEFENAARALRRLLGIEFEPRPDMVTVVFKLKHHGLIANYRRVPDAEMPDGEAYFDPFEKILQQLKNKDDSRALNELDDAIRKLKRIAARLVSESA